MKIVCSQIDLKNNLAIVSRVVPSRPTHPILANILLVADKAKNQVKLTGFDLSLGMSTNFSAQVEDGGTITLPAKFLNDIVNRLPEGDISISYDEDELEENPFVSIDSLSGNFQLRGVKGDEYPELPTVDNQEAFLLPVNSLVEGLKGSLFSASADETKQVLTGVHLTRDLDTLEFAATDGHRLAVVKTIEEKPESEENVEETPISPDQNFTLTIPARALKELENLLLKSKEDECVSLYVDQGQVVFQLGEQHLTSRKLEGAYPNYNQLIPKTFERNMIVDRKLLIESLERVSVFTDQKNSLVKFKLEPENSQLFISVEAKELGNAQQSITAEITGMPFEIGFNIKYLMDGLKALSANDIKFQFNGATQPVIATPLSGLQMTYLIMPVQIRE